eukprot:EG_transcript_915
MPPSPSPCLAAGDEAARLEVIHGAHLLTVLPEEHYNAVSEVVARLFQTPTATLLLVAEGRVWVKGQYGLTATDSLQADPLVDSVINSGCSLVVLDAAAEDAFAGGALVAGPPFVRFFAAAPVLLPGTALCLGLLCVFDSQPRLANMAQHVPVLEAQARVAAQLVALAVRQADQQRELHQAWERLSRGVQSPLRRIAAAAGGPPGGRPSPAAEVRPGLQPIALAAEQGLAALEEMAAVASGQIPLRAEPFDLRACVEAVLGIAAGCIHAQHVSVGYELDRDAEVTGDAAQLRRVLGQLLGNAVAATKQGTVRLRVEVEPGQGAGDAQVRFEVSDTGPGLAPACLREALRAGRPQPGGSGLPACVAICQALGGRLCVESTEGRGTRCHFTLRMPARVLPEPALGRRVFVVDAAPPPESFLFAHCRALGLHTTHCPTPAAARDLAASQPPDAIVCDASAFHSAGPTPPPPGSVPWLFVGGPGARLPSPALRSPVRQTELRARLLALWQEAPAGCSVLPSTVSVAIVDSDAIHRAVLGGFLKRLGGAADSWLGGADVVAAAQTRHYDVVFLELGGHAAAGWDAAVQLRALDRPPYIVGVVADPAVADEADLAGRCRAAGVGDVLRKPLRYAPVCTALQRFLQAGPSGHSQKSDPGQAPSSPANKKPRPSGPPCPTPPSTVSPTPSPRLHARFTSLAKPLRVDTDPPPQTPPNTSFTDEAGLLLPTTGPVLSPSSRPHRLGRSPASAHLPILVMRPGSECSGPLAPSTPTGSDSRSSLGECPTPDSPDSPLPSPRGSLPSGISSTPGGLSPRSAHGSQRYLGSLAVDSDLDPEPLTMAGILQEDLQPLLLRTHSQRLPHSPRAAMAMHRYPSMPSGRFAGRAFPSSRPSRPETSGEPLMAFTPLPPPDEDTAG